MIDNMPGRLSNELGVLRDAIASFPVGSPEWNVAMELLQDALDAGTAPIDALAGRSDTSGATTAAVRTAGSAGLAKEIAKICGKAGAAGALVDGAVGGLQAASHVRDGTIDTTRAAKHVGAEAGCGFITSSSGTAGTLAVFMLTGSMGPAALAAGMGASMGSRYLYRQVVGETLPDEEEMAEEARRQAEAEMDQSESGKDAPSSGADTPGPNVEDIGPDTDPREWLEEIGPDSEEGSDASDDTEPSEGDDADPFEDIGPGGT